ncbi:MAG TPA: c-type cytochrome [Thermoanaerobaculia bacterium]|nr:c-type cytochrome [Thermoanaerobaculia bacterium]
MPRRAPAEPIDHHYNIPRLNRVFAYTGIILTVVFIAMVVEDYARPWKRIQRAFTKIEARKARQSALEARNKAVGEEGKRLRAELALANKELAAHRNELRRLDRKLEELEPKVYLADQQFKFTKASLDAQRYKYENALATAPRTAPKHKRDLDELEAELENHRLALARVQKEEADTRSARELLVERREQVALSIEKLTTEYRVARKRFESFRDTALFQARNSPILDMVNPSLRVQQVQLPEHYTDVNFMKIPRVDRCQTCHIAADRTGFDDPKSNVVFRSHPRQELMIGSESAHPVNLFGCSPCHGGRDRASSFWSAGHSPESPKEAERWTNALNWKFDRFNQTPILPMKYTEAGCYRCHADETNFREAPKLDAGMKLVEDLGCWGCHRIEGLEKQGLPRVGPSLERIASKVTRDWTTRWVMKPDSFRASTKMPQFFYLENFVDVSGPKPPTEAQKRMNEQGRIENDAMVNSIVAYLFAKSRGENVPPVAGAGDAARGATLLAERGCFGCHLADPNARRDLTGTYRQFGPNLAGIGSKVSRDWIYHWVLDPKAWSPDTKMPNLRLTPAEALDIAEYLSTLKASAEFERVGLPATDPATLDRIALYFQMSDKTLLDAKATLAKMDLHSKEVYTGEKLIAHQGCFACHAIPGFEDAKPIGTELTEEGSKTVHLLDFGFIHIPHTRHDWFETKVKSPRIFDRDRARGWEEKYRMPDFHLSEREREQVVTAVLGFQDLNAAPTARKRLSPDEEAIERGRRIVKSNNCLGCHVIEGYGGSFRSLVADTSLAPPIIQGQGAKVQSDWLYSFLKAPKTGEIRPWLEVHMPTFGFTSDELNDLTHYFASLDRASYPFLDADHPTDPGRWAAGKKVFELLRCRQCHPSSVQEMNAPGVDRASLAPNLQMSATRLRHEWIADWIKRPDEWMPGTRMPTNFPKGDDGKRTSPIAALLDAPTFAADRAEFARLLGGDEAAKKFLSDPDAVTKALRDYVWSVGITGGTAPAQPSGPRDGARPAPTPGARTATTAGSRTAAAPGGR